MVQRRLLPPNMSKLVHTGRSGWSQPTCRGWCTWEAPAWSNPA
jgi:hypothetical protein